MTMTNLQAPKIRELRENISATDPDWTREEGPRFRWRPNLSLIRAFRDYQRAVEKNSHILRFSAKWRHRFWSTVTGADIPLECELGGGLMIPHPNGIVILPSSKIGPNCLILQQVTIGTNGVGTPILEGRVDVGAGAKILGNIRIGAHARIGANAVVLQDVPPGATAVGVPARIIPASLG